MKETFELQSFKYDALGAEVKYRVTQEQDEAVTDTDYRVRIARGIHAQLQEVFDELRSIVADIFRTSKGELPCNNITPTGIAFSGKEDRKGIIITGIFGTALGDVKFKTPRIKYLTGDNSICAALTVFEEKVVAEVQAFLNGAGQDMEDLF